MFTAAIFVLLFYNITGDSFVFYEFFFIRIKLEKKITLVMIQ